MRKRIFTHIHIKYARKQLVAVRKMIKFYKQYTLQGIPPSYIDNNENGEEWCPLCVATVTNPKGCVQFKCSNCLWTIIWGKECTDYPNYDDQQTRTRLHRLRVFEKVLLKQLSKSKEMKN